MKYTIETTENGCVETLEMNDGNKYTKRHVRTSFGSTCEDLEFFEQMEEDGIRDDEFLDKVYDVFDGFFVSNFIDIDEML